MTSVRHLLTGTELSRDDLTAVLRRAHELKAHPVTGGTEPPHPRSLAGRSVGSRAEVTAALRAWLARPAG